VRIVSLLASATEIACVLGLEDSLVGISHECDFPPQVLDRPRVSHTRFDPTVLDSGAIDRAVREAMERDGSVYAIDRDLLTRLRPDLVLTQAICDVCAVPTTDVEEAVRACDLDTQVLPVDAHTIDDILKNVLALGHVAGVPDRARDFIAEARKRLSAVREAVEGEPRPRVLALEWLDPPFAPGHWVPEMIEIGGGDNVLGYPALPSAEVAWGVLTGRDPDVLLIMPCGYGLAAARRDADRSSKHLLKVAPRAIDEGRAFVVDASSYFNRSGPRVVDGVEILGHLLHPERVPSPPGGRAAPWQPEAKARL
jgi:iron complex transport system substrate-binding protein